MKTEANSCMLPRMRLARLAQVRRLERLLREYPVVALPGARQVEQNTLAREIMDRHKGPATLFDREDPRDLAQLEEPTLALAGLRALAVLNEIQRRPDLFGVLRVLAARPRRPARFLVLGSASPDLLRQGPRRLRAVLRSTTWVVSAWRR